MPQTSIVPSVGLDRPSSSRNIVVLPAPLAPTRPTRPRGNANDRSSRAVTPGYRLVRPSMRRSVSATTTPQSLPRRYHDEAATTVDEVVTLDDVATIAAELPEVWEGERGRE